MEKDRLACWLLSIAPTRSSPRPLSGLRIELDHYTCTEHIYGKNAADRLIGTAAYVIRKRLRDADFLLRRNCAT